MDWRGMKTYRVDSLGMGLALSVLVILAAGCATDVKVERTDKVPMASATAEVRQDDNDNTKLVLEVENLADPTTLDPSRATYVVWAESREGRFHLLGQLMVDDEGAGEYRGTIPAEAFRLVVSAENEETPEKPGGTIVLKTKYIEELGK